MGDQFHRPPVLMLMGPTAAGKTELALNIASHRECEMISVDSVQVYRGMDVGTAKPGADVLARCPHHLIDIRDPDQPYSAAEFRRDALAAVSEIHAAGKMPVLVGGTMLYFRILIEGLDELPAADPQIRAALSKQIERDGPQALHAELQRVDPTAAARIHPNNRQRLQRALEVWRTTGIPISSLHQRHKQSPHPWRLVQVAIAPQDRAVLHARIDERFRAMLATGLVEELARLRECYRLHPDLPSMRAVGYRQVLRYLDGQSTYEEMVERGIIATRQLAKRQLTWLRGWPALEWLLTDDSQNCVNALGRPLSQEGGAALPVDQVLKLIGSSTI